MIQPYTIKFESPAQDPVILNIQSHESATKVKEIMRTFLAQKHGNNLTLFDLDVFIMFFYSSLNQREIRQLTYELKNAPTVAHSITIDTSENLQEKGLTFSEDDLVRSTDYTEASNPPLQIPKLFTKKTARKICKEVFFPSIAMTSEHTSSNKSIFSSKEADNAKDPILCAFFNSKNLSRISLTDLEYEGADITEYTIDTEAPNYSCTVS